MRDEELRLWNEYNRTKSPVVLEQLLIKLKPLIRSEASKYRQTGIPITQLESKAEELAFDAIKSYKPERGVQLNTHIINHIQRLNRYAIEKQNIVRSQEAKIFQYRKFESAKNELESTLGREPTELELRAKLGVGFKFNEIQDFKPTKEHLYAKSVEEGGKAPVRSDLTSDQITLRLIRQGLTDKEKQVFDYAYGMDGKPVLKKKEIARRLGISQPMISKYIRKIDAKYKAYDRASLKIWGR